MTQFDCVMMLLLAQEAHGERTLLPPREADGGLRGEEMTYRFLKKRGKEDRRALKCGKRGEAWECNVFPALRRAKMRSDKDINRCAVCEWEHITLKPWNGREKRLR